MGAAMSRKLLLAVRLLLLIAVFGSPVPCSADSSRYSPCHSIRESKFRGYFLCAVSFEPNVFTWKGKEIKIKEAWLEQAHERLLIGTKPASHFNMCVNLSTGWD